MQIHRLKLTNYRNHKSLELNFNNKLNIIYGDNGAGKTNILEAIHTLATTKPYKATYDREIINHKENFTRLEGTINTQGQTYELEQLVIKTEYDDNTSKKKLLVNKVAKSVHYFIGLLNTVIFAPQDIEILTGSPAQRRKQLDIVLTQTDSEYKQALSKYIKAIKQRNKILELYPQNDIMEYWTMQLIESGNIIQQKRKNYINFLHKYSLANKSMLDISGVFYKQSELTQERLALYRERELAAKKTLLGPHRDDFWIEINGFNIGSFGSRGQQRSALLTLKLGEIDFITQTTSERPVLLLDDIFSEFDEYHKKEIKNLITKQQTIITSATEYGTLGLEDTSSIVILGA